MEGKFLENRNYRTYYNIHLIPSSFSVLSNSLDEHFFIYLFIFYFFKGFYSKNFFWTIITTVPIIVYCWTGAHFLCCQILCMSIFLFILFDFLKGFYSKEIFWTIITTVPVIVYSWSSAHSLLCLILLISIFLLIFFDFLKGFYNYCTRHSIHLIRCSFCSLSNSFDEHYFIYFFLLP